MKNTTKTIAAVLAVFLAAALFVGAASAIDTAREIDNSTAFVYENITIAGESGHQGYLNFFDKDDVFVTSIASNATTGAFNLLDVSVGSNTGIWYYGKSPNTMGDKTVNIQYPKLSIDLRKGTNSLDGQSIIRGESGLKLVLDAQYMTEDMGANVSVLTTTPEGGKSYGIFTHDNGQELKPLPLTGVQTTYSLDLVDTTVQAGTYTVQAEFMTGQKFGLFNTTNLVMPAQYKKSNTITVTINSADLTITAAKESVIRSNPFTVTVTGEALKDYYLIVETTGSPKGIDFLPGQKDVTINDNTNATITTDASGKIQVEFSTEANTEDKTYTIKVYGILSNGQKDTSNYDTAKVKVEKGSITVSASSQMFYLGNEILLSGTNSDSKYVTIYFDGPNTNFETLDSVSVNTDNTWEYKFDTADKFSSKDVGSYTFYFIATEDKNDEVTKATLSGHEYETYSMTFKKPFLTATSSASVVAIGDDVYIRGTAEGNPSDVTYYIFGTNFYDYGTISVEDDGTYEKKLTLSDATAGQYYVVVEHPMENGVLDVHQAYRSDKGYYYNTIEALESDEVHEDSTYESTILFIPQASYLGISTFSDSEWGKIPASVDGVRDLDLVVRTAQSSFIVEGTGKLQSSQAADTLGKNINDANIDDTYVKLTFNLVQPKITINNPGDQGVGTTFTVSGTTNLAVDDEILIEIQSTAFDAVDKSQSSGTSGYTQATKVVAGDGIDNVWSIEVDTTNWELDEYNIKAEAIGKSVQDTATFNLVEKVVTPTATATGATPTTTATATATTAPTQTPGFGAFVALAGLGAVALLVLRRN